MVFTAICLKECEKINPHGRRVTLVNPPSRRTSQSKMLISALTFGIVFLYLFDSAFLYGKDQQQMSRLTNNKTFYASEVPLKPATTLIAMRHTPAYEPLSMLFDSIKATKLATIAYENAHRFKASRRRCMRSVRVALQKLIGKPLDLNSLPSDPAATHKKRQSLPGLSSENFIKWALNNPISLCQNLKLANVTEYPDLASHEGVIHFYAKGSCGFSRRYGHVEVLTNKNKGEACSDHCRTISKPCTPDLALAPVTDCDTIAYNRKKDVGAPMSKDKPILMTKYIERPPAN